MPTPCGVFTHPTLQTVICGLIIPFTYVQVTPVEGLWDVYNLNVKIGILELFSMEYGRQF